MKTKNKVAMNARRRGLMGGTLLGAMLCCSAIGAVTWTGGGAGNWSDANRWESGTVPTANDAVRLQNGANLVIDEDALLGQGGLIGGCGGIRGTKAWAIRRIRHMSVKTVRWC